MLAQRLAAFFAENKNNKQIREQPAGKRWVDFFTGLNCGAFLLHAAWEIQA